MNSVESVLSSDEIIRIFIFLLYVPVCVISFWQLIPRLSRSAARLACLMLLAQLLVVALSLEATLTSQFDKWLWDFHEEWNIAATLASTQLGMVGGVALATAWLARASPAIVRFYLAGTGGVFVFLGLDEYLALHEFIEAWELYYIALGAAVVAATLVVARRSTRTVWIWHCCLLFGLALSALGAMVFNALPPICDNLGSLRLDGCLQFYFQEETLELLGIWLALVAMLGHFSEAVLTPRARVRALPYTLPVLWILLLLLNSLVPRLELRLIAQPAAVEFESGLLLHGYTLENLSEFSRLRLFVSARQREVLGLGYSIHLVDQVSGESVASLDEWADRQHGFWLFGPNYSPLHGQWMEVQLPPEAPVNRALSVVLTLWRKKGGQFKPYEVRASDRQLVNDAQVLLGERVVAAEAAASRAAPLAEFDNGFILEAAELPERAQAGETLSINFAWRSKAESREDHVQFLHLGHEETGAWFVYDQPPLGPRLPARLWYSGLADSETWRVPLPPELAPGQYRVFTGIYRARDRERVAASNSTGERWLDARVRLGMLIIE
ncbi:MAG: hypothetical protein OXT68_08345 [Chloroflexota bacterium]|nr:hypothetical protein [Chloroflexota bacterium]